MIDKDINKRAVESMIMCGAFDSMGVKRSQLMAVYEEAISAEGEARRGNLEGQFSLFDDDAPKEMEFPEREEFSKRELLKMEKQTIGMYLSGHPVEEYTDRIAKITKYNIGNVLSAVEKDEEGNVKLVDNGMCDGMFMRLCGIISTRKNKTTRNNSQMAFVTLEDMYGSLECIVFPKVLMQYSHVLQEGEVVVMEGKLSIRDDEEPKILCEKATPIEGAENTPRTVFIKIPDKNSSAIEGLTKAAKEHPGTVNVCIYIESTKERFNVPDKLKVSGTQKCVSDLEKCFGKECVKAVF